ncbi:MAG: DegT/DnrJ/EryC1/StrS family aminotransferase [Phycisphaerales bacterium]|nr:DegT/DnrJ/EryC1/StrS family aminotransferase [Phycisphaerales bacterium]
MSHHDIPLSKPNITKLEEERVLEVMRSGRLSIGPMQDRFEELVAQRCGTTHAIACSSGTSGLHMILVALGIGPGDEVITTPFSFIASSNAILYVGAKPVFVDICPSSLNANPELIEKAITPRTKAILAVEAFGNPRHMDTYARIAAKNEIHLVEDSCEALGSVFNDHRAGSFGRAGVFGFYPNKQITTGEGGMIVTNDDRLAEVCRSLRNQGRAVAGRGSIQSGSAAGSWLHHERLGFNYRMSEINAAIGVAQMERLDEIIESRNEAADLYIERLLDIPDLILPTVDAQCSTMSWFVFVVRLAAGYTREERDRVIAGLRMHEIGAGDYFPCIHLQPIYQQAHGYTEGSFPIAESVSQRTLALPFFAGITKREVDIVAQTLELMISRENLSRRN